MTRSPTVAFAVLAALLVARSPALDASPSPGDGPEAPARFPAVVPAKPGATDLRFDRPVVTRSTPGRLRAGRAPEGTLRGKTVYVSAGHGWNYAAGAWRTQRGNTHDLVEDFITVEGVNQFLIPYLHAMGAYVVPIREADLNPKVVVVNDEAATIEGTVAELGGDAGWGPLPVPFTGTQNPFALGRARSMTATATETGRAVYATPVAESGYYNVYVSWVQGDDRVSDAHVIVRHAGGESHLRVDQRRHGSTWVLLGRWYFEAGADVTAASIVIPNDSADAGRVISFDAVRLGGGMAPHQRGGGTTGRAAYESAGRYAAQLLGAPESVWAFSTDDSSNDVLSRPRFAAWEHEAGEDAVYLAWHTNAPTPIRGTQTIAYGNTYPCCSGLGDFAGTAGSIELLHAVHDEILADVRAGYDPAWRDAGKATASLGELRPSNNNEMPAILVELAFHDTALDADALRDPRFRQIAARAMAQGIARYFAAKDQRALVLPPEPPAAVRLENIGDGSLRVSWRPPATDRAGGDAPTSYRVHVSTNGYGFDDGIEVTGESTVLAELPRGALRFVRVTAINAGGESLPSEVVGARRAASGKAPLLLVGGVDRLDAAQSVRDAAPLVGTVDRMWIDRMNNGTYAARHATALAAAGFAFDGASDEAIEQGDVDLANYRAIDWFVGEDSTGEDPLSATSREALERFFLGGGSLLLSGSEVVWTLADQGIPEAKLFASTHLHTTLMSDDAATYDVLAVDGLFAGLAPFSFRDEGPLDYDADFPDVLAPANAATTVLTYATGGPAAITWDDRDGDGSRGIVMGFPIEMIADDGARQDLLATALAAFGIEPDPDAPEDPDDPEDPAGAGCGCGATDPGATGLLALGLVAILARRRRRGRAG